MMHQDKQDGVLSDDALEAVTGGIQPRQPPSFTNPIEAAFDRVRGALEQLFRRIFNF
jgi:hypothetical protein